MSSNGPVRRSPFNRLLRSTATSERPRTLSPEEIADAEFCAKVEAGEIAEFEAKERALEALMNKFAEQLAEISADPEIQTARSKAALAWLVQRPERLLTFLRSGNWHSGHEGFRRIRRGMMAPEPDIPAVSARTNGVLFGDAVEILLKALVGAEPYDDLDGGRSRMLEAIGRTYLEQLQESYMVDAKNPVFAWQAFSTARLFGLSLPLWVLEYLDRCAANVRAMAMPRRDRIDKWTPGMKDKSITEIFEFDGKQTIPGAPLSRAQRCERDNKIFAFLHSHRNNEEGWDGETIRQATGMFQLQDLMLRNVYNAKRAELGLPPKPKHETRGRPKG